MDLRILGEVGERNLIDVMMRHLTPMPKTPMPFWDDVSAVTIGRGRAAILKADMLVWKTDVPQGMTPFQAARKAVVMNFSDLGSKGVQPAAFLVSLGLPRGLAVDFVEEMARGFEAGAREYDAYVVGGDTSEAGEVIIGGMAFGVAEEKALMKREGARPGDILATTGGFGNTAAAFKILLEGYEAPPELRASLVDSVYMPRARVKEGTALARSGSISASMDSSDGLAMSLHDLSRSSDVGFRVERLPASPEATRFAEMHGLDLSELVFYGGEEYELVLTVRPDAMNSARAALKEVGRELIELGRATGERRIVYYDGVEEKPLRSGYEHFK
jgi:thiamine-monophosphate kinase